MRRATVRHGIYWRHLQDIYGVRTVRSALAYGLPFVVSLAAIVGHLVSGRAGEAAAELAKAATGLR